MCQLIARSGLVAIAYANRNPVADLLTLFDHVHEYAQSLRIDPARVGIVAVSGNVPTALAILMQDASRTPTCAVLGYGCLLDLDGMTDVADAARQFGFANPCVGRTVADLRRREAVARRAREIVRDEAAREVTDVLDGKAVARLT